MKNYEDLTNNQLFIELYRCNKSFIDITDKICKKYGINQLQLYIIGLSTNGTNTISMIAETLGLPYEEVSQAIVGLIIRRILTKMPSIEKKHVFYVVPTKNTDVIRKELSLAFKEKYQQAEISMGKFNFNLFIELMYQFNKAVDR